MRNNTAERWCFPFQPGHIAKIEEIAGIIIDIVINIHDNLSIEGTGLCTQLIDTCYIDKTNSYVAKWAEDYDDLVYYNLIAVPIYVGDYDAETSSKG